MQCTLCGSKNADRKTEVDGNVLNVCKNCVKFGKQVATVEYRTVKKKNIEIPDVGLLKEDFSKIVRKQRQKMKLNRKDLANKLQIKESTLKRIEEGWEPDSKTIKKVEKFFNISIVE